VQNTKDTVVVAELYLRASFATLRTAACCNRALLWC
jgi:hypothetical protein